MKNSTAIPKTITYRIYSFIIMLGITYFLTGNIREMFALSLGIEAIKLFQYYCFEIMFDKYVSRR